MSIFFCLSTLAILNRQFVPDRFSSPPISDPGFGTEDAPLFVLEQRMRHYLFDSYEEQLSCTFTSKVCDSMKRIPGTEGSTTWPCEDWDLPALEPSSHFQSGISETRRIIHSFNSSKLSTASSIVTAIKLLLLATSWISSFGITA